MKHCSRILLVDHDADYLRVAVEGFGAEQFTMPSLSSDHAREVLQRNGFGYFDAVITALRIEGSPLKLKGIDVAIEACRFGVAQVYVHTPNAHEFLPLLQRKFDIESRQHGISLERVCIVSRPSPQGLHRVLKKI